MVNQSGNSSVLYKSWKECAPQDVSWILVGRAVREERPVVERMSIPPNIAEAFFDAVRTYVRWAFTAPEPSIIVDGDEAIPISRVCERVEAFNDPLPNEVFNALYFLVTDETRRHLKEKLGADRTYATVAQCLLKLIEDRQAEWREEWQRTQ
jgi:hypothetical protein